MNQLKAQLKTQISDKSLPKTQNPLWKTPNSSSIVQNKENETCPWIGWLVAEVGLILTRSVVVIFVNLEQGIGDQQRGKLRRAGWQPGSAAKKKKIERQARARGWAFIFRIRAQLSVCLVVLLWLFFKCFLFKNILK